MKTANVANFAKDRNATSSLEFAVNALALVLFLFGIINLGDLGLTVGTMKRAVQAAVRAATVQTSAAMAQTGSPSACATAAQIIADFNGIASPILPPASASNNPGYPTISYSWTNATALTQIPGTILTVTVAYRWVPLGMSQNFGPGIPLSIASTQLVIGTSGAITSCA